MLGVFIREGDTGVPVVNLLAAEALVARREGCTGQLSAGTVDWLLVVVVRHRAFPCLVLYAPHYIYIIDKSKPQTPP